MENSNFKYLLVYYFGKGNQVRNMSSNVFTIFRSTEREPECGYYIAAIHSQAKDKNENTIYIVDLKSQVPMSCIPEDGHLISQDNTNFYNAIEIVTSSTLLVNTFFLRLINNIRLGKFANGEFEKNKIERLYNLVIYDGINKNTLRNLEQIFKKVQFLVTRNAKEYLPELIKAVGTKQITSDVPFKLNDINDVFKRNRYIEFCNLNFYRIPIVYANLEQDTLDLKDIINKKRWCLNFSYTIISKKDKLFFKFNTEKRCA